MRRADKVHIETLDVAFKTEATSFLEKANEWAGSSTCPFDTIIVGITSSRRSLVVQAGLYTQGRRWHSDTLTWEKVGDTVTNTMESKHVLGWAIDVAPFKQDRGRFTPFWPNPRSKDPNAKDRALKFWLGLAHIATGLGLIAGALWPNPDYPHFEGRPK